MSVQAMPTGGVKAAPVPVPLTQDDMKTVNRLTGWNVGIAIGALTLGALLGILQGLEHAGLDLYPFLSPDIRTYYQGLSLHGVLNALVWTTFFICGFLTYITVKSLNRPLRYPWINWAGLIVMVVGLLMSAFALLTNQASVLYTFYPPMMAAWFHYVGLTLVVVGTWVVTLGLLFTYWTWRKEHPGERTPFLALASLITFVMWFLATLGVATEMLIMVIPWSLGLVDGVDPLLARTLFWWFGHPLVYFWLLPAYISWYGMLPAQTNGKMFSPALAYLVFWLFLVLSTPVGFHHQYTDPGIPQAWKFLHMVLTMGVAFPSLLTAFTVTASLEVGGRARGGRGYFDWIRKLNWGDPSYAAQNLAAILFVFGGIGGMINASYNLNLLIHNTTWVPGHFHLTVGAATTLTFFGISYWLVPKLSGRKLLSNWMGLGQAWTWFFGMLIFANAYHSLGLYFGAPRRSMLGAAPYAMAEWQPILLYSTLGLTLLFISATLYFVNIFGTVLFGKKIDSDEIVVPIAEPLDPKPVPKWLDTWWPWVNGAIFLLLLSYGPMLYQLFRDSQWLWPGRVVW